MTKHQRVAVIMAGGSGERFWPLSREHMPKQLLQLGKSGQTLLEQAIDRVLEPFGAENIFIATGQPMSDFIAEGAHGLDRDNILAEPDKRNTSGALIWAAANMMARYGEDAPITMAVLTADHIIKPIPAFIRTVEAALANAEQHESIVTIGIRPSRPETGYGYIEIEEPLEVVPGYDDVRPYRVHRFREKPNQQVAEEFTASGRHLWNSGMFFWTVATFLRELEDAQPAMAAAARQIATALRVGDTETAESVFRDLESISIDFALMEKSRHVLVVRALFEWEDVGSWDSLSRTKARDSRGNVRVGEPVLVDVHDSIVYCNEDGAEMSVCVVGVKGLVVVTTRDGVLIVHKDRVQDVRKAVSELKRRGSNHI